MKIGLLSDTHGYLDDAVFKYFEGCDEVWHAGDFGDAEIVHKLAAFKPFKGVYGNIDGKDIRLLCPEHLRFTCEGVDVWMTRTCGYSGPYAPQVNKDIRRPPPRLSICGHSHILNVQYAPTLELSHP